jgi:polyphosphate kinase
MADGGDRDTGFRCVLRDREQLEELASGPLPAGLRESARASAWHRDIYFDTADGALRARGAACRLRHRADGRTFLTLVLAGDGTGAAPVRVEAEVADPDPAKALAAGSEPARRLLAFTDPVLLGPRLELEVARIRREARTGFLRLGRCDFYYDDVTVRHGELARSFQEVKVQCAGSGGPGLDAIARELADRHALRPALASRLERAEAIRARLAEEALTLRVGPGKSVVLAVMSAGEMAVTGAGSEMRLPTGPGAGEAACRHALHMLFQSRVGALHRIGTVAGETGDRAFEVWLVRRVRGSAGEAPPGDIAWVPLPALMDAVSTGSLRDPVTSAAVDLVAASGLLTGATVVRAPAPERQRASVPAPPLEEVLDGPLSELAFIERVLGLAEDARVPLLERVRYLAIVSSNLDEFYMGTAGGLRQASSPDDQDEVAHLEAQVELLLDRQRAALDHCLAELAREGVALRTWDSLAEPEREVMREYFHDEIFPQLTPRAITTSPGHPFPVIPALSLAFAVVLAGDGRPQHYAYLRLPDDVPRFLPIDGSTGLLPVEELVRAELARVYPDRAVVSASLFRVTRLSELDVDESRAGNLLQAMEEDVARRRSNPVVRIEVEAGMPERVLEMLVRELRFEERSDAATGLGPTIRRVEGLLAPGDVRELASVPVAGGEFPPFTPRHPLAPDVGIWDQVRAADRLVHHPYDDFGTTVVRLLTAAATDPGVVAIRMTLYRAGDRSPLVDALQLAAKEGKDVSVFVELKARFDEARNVLWVRRLEAAGVHVVYGLVGLKNHAKVAMIVRREDDVLRRYVHIGTGNYNAGTARVYTDLGLMTADPVIGDDVNDLFNQLTGTSGPPRAPFQRLLVAPVRLLPGIIARIDREAEHARAGRGGRIRIKCNGLADDEVVRAFYRASQAGVEVDLVVRGICTLRPGVPGLSERIRVRSILGRFLEHARIYSFGNGGEPEYWIGSADLRPRNLRRRIEVLAPILDEGCRRRLDALLELDLRDPTAWLLGPDGKYARPAAAVGDPASAQQTLLDEIVP